jgi:carbon monoxide dehydrogenase subunit G
LVELIGDYEFPVPPHVLWDALQDPDLLARVLPGCQRLEKVSETEFKGNIKITVGPVQGTFQGTIVYSEMQPSESLSLAVNARGPSGIVNGEGALVLTATETGTLMRYQGEGKVGGRMASVSQRLMESSAKAVTKQSLQSLEKQVGFKAESLADVDMETAVSADPVSQQSPVLDAPPAPSQTEFMLGVTQELLEEYIPNPQHRKLLAGAAILLAMFAMMEWCTSRIAKKTAKIIQEEKLN